MQYIWEYGNCYNTAMGLKKTYSCRPLLDIIPVLSFITASLSTTVNSASLLAQCPRPGHNCRLTVGDKCCTYGKLISISVRSAAGMCAPGLPMDAKLSLLYKPMTFLYGRANASYRTSSGLICKRPETSYRASWTKIPLPACLKISCLYSLKPRIDMMIHQKRSISD